MKGILYLASYPKSGNTWLRVFLANLIREQETPIKISDINNDSIASDRVMFDEVIGVESGELTHDEVDELRPEVYTYIAKKAKKLIHCKVHDAYRVLPSGKALFPLSNNCRAIYVLRNPLDVCVSFTYHQGHQDFDATIAQMADSSFELNGRLDRQSTQLRQRLLSWSEHLDSWTQAPTSLVHTIRFEDMYSSPVSTFTAIAEFAGYPSDSNRVERAIKASEFGELQKQEAELGFSESAAPKRAFFRSGKSGSWRHELSNAQIRTIVEKHRHTMQKFGYLNDSGVPCTELSNEELFWKCN